MFAGEERMRGKVRALTSDSEAKLCSSAHPASLQDGVLQCAVPVLEPTASTEK